ncbi:hypothetical protein Lser_V15G16634 [Lactuca serriola]
MARIKPQALLQQSKKKKAPRSISIPTIALYKVSNADRGKNIKLSVVEDDFSDSKKSDVPRYVKHKTDNLHCCST